MSKNSGNITKWHHMDNSDSPWPATTMRRSKSPWGPWTWTYYKPQVWKSETQPNEAIKLGILHTVRYWHVLGMYTGVKVEDKDRSIESIPRRPPNPGRPLQKERDFFTKLRPTQCMLEERKKEDNMTLFPWLSQMIQSLCYNILKASYSRTSLLYLKVKKILTLHVPLNAFLVVFFGSLPRTQ